MGLFNTINIDLLCPSCHCIVDWQSKYMEYHGYILADIMQMINLEPSMNGEMHTYCENCDMYLRYNIEDGKVIIND